MTKRAPAAACVLWLLAWSVTSGCGSTSSGSDGHAGSANNPMPADGAGSSSVTAGGASGDAGSRGLGGAGSGGPILAAGASGAAPTLAGADPRCSQTKGKAGRADAFDPDVVISGDAQMAIWLPCLDKLRGLVFFDGVPIIETPTTDAKEMWRNDQRRKQALTIHDFGALWGFAVMSGDSWKPDGDQTKIFDATLAEFAIKTQRPELPNLPLVFIGDSRRGQLGFRIEQAHPGMVIANAALSAQAPDDADGTYGVPTLIMPGVKGNAAQELPSALGALPAQRAKGALWAIAPKWGYDHGVYNNYMLALPFFDQVVRLRLPAQVDATKGRVTLNQLPEAAGWLGSNDTWGDVAPHVSYAGDRGKASWLPNAYVARAWYAYVTQKYPLEITEPAGEWSMGHSFDWKSSNGAAALPYAVKATLNGASPDRVDFFDGDRLLGTAQLGSDGKTYGLSGATFEPGVRALLGFDSAGRAVTTCVGFTVNGK